MTNRGGFDCIHFVLDALVPAPQVRPRHKQPHILDPAGWQDIDAGPEPNLDKIADAKTLALDMMNRVLTMATESGLPPDDGRGTMSPASSLVVGKQRRAEGQEF